MNVKKEMLEYIKVIKLENGTKIKLCMKIGFTLFILLVLMTTFGGLGSEATAKTYYYTPNKNIILIQNVNNKTDHNNQSASANSDNTTCSVSAPVTTNSSELKIRVLPPKIVMNYASKIYNGELSEAKYRAGSTFNELHVSPQNITTNLPSNVIHIQEDSCVQFLIKGTTKQLPPSSLAVTAYAANTGTAVKVLNATNYDTSIFRMSLNKGPYILLATATWLPGSEDVTGYVIYKFMASVDN
jgi:hypothetical protein